MRTGALKQVLYWMAKYLADIHNISADETLDWATPWSKRKGETLDILAFLQFRFYERVYYMDPDDKFPVMKEKTGYCLGVTQHVGDALCFFILSTDTHIVLERSVVRSDETGEDVNHTLPFPDDVFRPAPLHNNDVLSHSSPSLSDQPFPEIPFRHTTAGGPRLRPTPTPTQQAVPVALCRSLRHRSNT